MEKIKNKNIDFNYIHLEKDITSFSIGFEGGALKEEGYPLGTAHALEHMLFKRTKIRNEEEINRDIDKYFGFSNAMTNYPYVIYYGTLLSNNFNKGMEVFADVINNPYFKKEELLEELKIIKEELKEWKDNSIRLLEDEAFFNGFNKRRIKYPIIGTEPSIDEINGDTLYSFYESNYNKNNIVITVASSLNKEEIGDSIEKYFPLKKEGSIEEFNIEYEKNIGGIFVRDNVNLLGAKMKYLFSTEKLNKKEEFALKVFDYIFGRPNFGILYNQIRTKESLCYDINTEIKNEKGIKLYSINVNVSKENIQRLISEIKNIISYIKNRDYEEEILDAIEKIELSKILRYEKSILLCNDTTISEIMGQENIVYDINNELIKDVINKVFNEETIQIIY